MAGKEPTKPTKSPASSRPTKRTPTTSTLTVSMQTPVNVAAGGRRETRASSPSAVPSELMVKYTTQVFRVAALQVLHDSLLSSMLGVTIDELNVYWAQMDEIHQAFLKDHAYFEVMWPVSYLSHEYFTETCLKEFQVLFNLKLTLHRFRKELEPFQHPHSQSSSASPGNLPESSLPTFKGTWNLLSERYQNKRILIQSQLDKIFSAQPVLTKGAAALNQLISTVEKARLSLMSLGVTDNLGDCILVHQVARNLDKATREAWETSLGSSQEYPTFHRIREFVTGKVRALEWVEAPPSCGASTKSSSTAGPSKAKVRKVSSHHSAQAHPSQKGYQCDCCGDDHFIVMCPKFRGLKVPERRKLIANKKLCYNCCGRHASTNCKSALRCKQCGNLHHSMLHVQKSQLTTQFDT